MGLNAVVKSDPSLSRVAFGRRFNNLTLRVILHRPGIHGNGQVFDLLIRGNNHRLGVEQACLFKCFGDGGVTESTHLWFGAGKTTVPELDANFLALCPIGV